MINHVSRSANGERGGRGNGGGGIGGRSRAGGSAPGPDLSALILTVTHGNTPVRTAVLMCSPMALGTHPQAVSACDELNAVGGNFDALRGQPIRFCSMLYDPVTLTADGFWHGTPVSWRQSFPNQCMAINHSNYVFTF